MDNEQIAQMLEFINILADQSGEIISKYYRNTDDISLKEDSSPVTVADIEVEKMLRCSINNSYPTHGIIGEEFSNQQQDARYKWVIDPIDGTASFVIGRPIFGTLIALVCDDKPIIGAIDQPINSERWVGVCGGDTYFNNSKVSSSNRTNIEDAILCTTSPEYFTQQGLELFNNVASKARQCSYGGDCYNYALLASGHVDIVIESGLKAHDFCALSAVVSGARGVMTDWQGNELNIHSDGDVVACANGSLHEKIIGILNDK